jgi:Na+-transporting NADH:ubiquinone oxidoreductase subunit C
MRTGKESVFRTLSVAAGVALVCSLIVSTAVFLLRPYQLAYSAVDRNRAILEALEILSPDDEVEARAIVTRFVDLDQRVVDLNSGSFTTDVDAATYDFREATQNPQAMVEIPAPEDIGGIGSRPQFMPVYLVVEGGDLQRIALPFYASGMWSTIYGYVALESDLQTIAGVVFYEHGETPGIGDRILDPQWLGSWRAKRVYGPEGDVRFSITANAQAAQAQYRVDSITGATVTVKAVNDAIQYWFSDHGYGRFLARLAEEGL